MKKICLIMCSVILFNCTPNDTLEEKISEVSVIGRWNLENFEGNILYEFTANKRYTLYSDNGVFETLEEVINSGRPGDDWWLEEGEIIIDLSFGNIFTSTPNFKCNNNVLELLNESSEVTGVYYREGYKLVNCDE